MINLYCAQTRVCVVTMAVVVEVVAVVTVVMVQYHVDPIKYAIPQAAHVQHHQIQVVSMLGSNLDARTRA
jgi:hypothetical protein